MPELKELQDEIQKTLHDFRQYVDKELKEIKEKGSADPQTTETIVKLNSRIDELQAKIQRPPQASADKPKFDKELVDFMRKGIVGPEAGARAKAMSVGSDADGGFFVSPDTSGRIVGKIYETTPMRRLASVETISTDKLTGPIDNDEVSTGWVGETGTRAETDTPETGQWEIMVHEQYAEPRITTQLLNDSSYNMEAWLAGKVADKFAREENSAFVIGTGVAKPRGITTYTTAATSDATRAWGIIEHINTGTAGDWTGANVDKLYDLIYALKAGYRQGASFLGPKAVMLKVRKFKDGNANYLWQPSLQAGQPSSLAGFPFEESEDMPAIGANSLSLAFANFKEAYTIVDRQGILVLRDPYTAKGWVKFYTTKRVGGGVVNFEAIKFLRFAA